MELSENIDNEEIILLGGQISGKHPIFKDLAQLASYGMPWWLFKSMQDPNWKKKTGRDKILDLIYTSGQVEFINNSSELTKLSAILGDYRQRFSSKGLKDVLGKLRVGSNSPASNSGSP